MKTQGGVPRPNRETGNIDHKAALKWALSNPDVCTAIPGMTSFEQLEQNFQVMADLSLSVPEKQALLAIRRNGGSLFCHNCRACTVQCPRRVDIPRIIRAFMYAEGYGNTLQGEATLAEISRGRGPYACRDCQECSVRCPNGIPVRERIEQFRQRFHLALS